MISRNLKPQWKACGLWKSTRKQVTDPKWHHCALSIVTVSKIHFWWLGHHASIPLASCGHNQKSNAKAIYDIRSELGLLAHELISLWQRDDLSGSSKNQSHPCQPQLFALCTGSQVGPQKLNSKTIESHSHEVLKCSEETEFWRTPLQRKRKREGVCSRTQGAKISPHACMELGA